MRFIIDAQLPPTLAVWLDAVGQASAHFGEMEGGSASDDAIWDHPRENGAVVVAADEDFTRHRMSAADGPLVIWIRLPITWRRDLIAWSAAVLPQVPAAPVFGETLVQVK